MSRYREIADDMRARIQSGQYPVGSTLPGISTLQQEYGVALNTVRAAHQLLAEEGMVESRQGVGVFVLSTTSLRQIDVMATLGAARDAVSTALAALAAPRHRVTFDLQDDDTYHVLSEALREWASRQRFDAEDEPEDDPLRAMRLRWAEVADRLHEQVEAAV